MTLILHITTRKDWEHAKQVGIYKPESLEKQGFIHCLYPSQLVRVAEANYSGRKDLVLLCIESNRVRADIREEGAGDESYPHVFGPLNLDSVARVLEFKTDKTGKFELPPSIVEASAQRTHLA
jgi:uncharacterized protein (DUF952 family)